MITAAQIERIKQHNDFDRIIAERLAVRIVARTGRTPNPETIANIAGRVKTDVTKHVNPALIDTFLQNGVPPTIQKMSVSTEDIRVDQNMEQTIDSLVRELLTEDGRGNEKKTRRSLRKAAMVALQKIIAYIN